MTLSLLQEQLLSHNKYFDKIVETRIPMKFRRQYEDDDENDDGGGPADVEDKTYYKGHHKDSKMAKRAIHKASHHLNDDKENDDENENDAQTPPDTPVANDTPMKEGQSRIQFLRERLATKLSKLSTSRESTKVGTDGGQAAVISKRAARRAEKLKRIELAKQRNKEKGITVHDKGKPLPKLVVGPTKQELEDAETMKQIDAKDLSTIDYGGIAGLKSTKANYLNNKSLKGAGKKKSLQKLLADAESKQERLAELKSSSNESDVEKSKRLEWGDTLKEATGDKTFLKQNNVTRIKKELKRQSKKKEKSAKAWKSRMDQQQAGMDERQKIRTHNLGKRKLGGAAAANLSSKRIAEEKDVGTPLAGGATAAAGDKKKRRRSNPHADKARAGFEGKKQDFLNAKK